MLSENYNQAVMIRILLQYVFVIHNKLKILTFQYSRNEGVNF